MQGNALNREEVQRSTLRLLLLVAALLVLPAWWQLANTSEPSLALLGACIGVSAGLAVIAFLVERRLELARRLFLATVLGGVLVARFAAGMEEAGYLFVFPVIICAALARPLAAAVMSLACSGLIIWAGGSSVALPVAVVAGSGLALWATMSYLHDLLDWSSQHSLEATVLAEQLRDQRGKLNRTIKDLDASYQLLQASNRELALARQEADSLRDLRSRFATNLSHELRTPLNIILGFSQLIYLNPDLYGQHKWSETLRRDLAQIQRNASYLSELVDDIVDLARVDAMAMPVRRESTQLAKLVQDVIATVHSLALDKGLELATDCPEPLPTLSLDPVRIRQVIFNLVTNAIRYTERGSVTVSARELPGEVVVSVKDTGCGIPPDQLERIFDEFYQVGRPRETPEMGKGLGLAIARRFVQLHGGRIWGESEIGRGSTFHFSLPLAQRSTSRLGEGSPVPVPAARKRPLVLLLGDDGTAATYLRRRFHEHDFLALEQPDGAGDLGTGVQPAAAIINRPLSGEVDPAWRAALQALPESMPVMECSLPSAEWLAGKERFNAFLSKPISPEALVAGLGKVLPPGDHASVLLVDDDRGFVQLVSRMLQAAGGRTYHISSAYNGDEALRRLHRSRPDAVLVDLVMPGMNGFDLLEAIRAEQTLAGLPVVAVSAATPGEDQMAAKGTTFTLARRGPFQAGELLKLIGAGLELANGQRPRAAEAQGGVRGAGSGEE